MPTFCESTKINSKYCKCSKCRKLVIKGVIGDEATAARQFPALCSQASAIKVRANVYVNYPRGMELFQAAMEGLPKPHYSEDNAPAVLDKNGKMSPWNAWQATLYVPRDNPMADDIVAEVKAAYGEDKVKETGSHFLVHSNALALFVLGLGLQASVAA